jgi:shikimate kinase
MAYWKRTSDLTKQMLVVITGPVGGGKSTVALALADRFRESGRTAAVIDLDLVYCMARQVEGFAEPNAWTTARRGAAALADAFFAEGMEVVIVEGEFFNQGELDALRNNLATAVECRFVTLVVSFEQSLARVSGDSSRGASRDPQFLKRLHSQFVEALPFLRASSLLVEADRQTPREIAQLIRDTVLQNAPQRGENSERVEFEDNGHRGRSRAHGQYSRGDVPDDDS